MSKRVAAVDAADPAGAHEADPGRAADGERAAHGRRPRLASRDADAELSRAGLPGRRVEPLQLAFGQADPDLAVQHADRRRHRARSADAPLALQPDRQALPRRKAVRDDRRLERDDGIGLADLVRDPDHGIVPRLATHRAAASIASSAPPTR